MRNLETGFVRFLLLFPALPLAASVGIVSIESSVLFPRGTPLRQVAYVTLLNDQASSVSCELAAGTAPASRVTAAPGVSKHRVLVDDLVSPADVTFTARCGAQPPVQKTQAWQPQRKWKVYVVKSSHEDLGYENYIFHKQHDIANFIDLAAELSGPRENVTESEREAATRFHYTMESLLFQRNYIEERGLVAWRRIVDRYIRPGAMHLMGAPSGVHSHWMDYEELARMTYPGRRETKDRYSLDLKTFMIVDNPSLSWAGAQAVADAGFRYVARWGQGWRTGGNNNYKTTKLPPLFWWRTPDGAHRVLYGWRSHYGISFWYGQTGGGYGSLIDLGAEQVSRQLKQIESGEELGPYPYDALVNPEYIDHDTPRFDTRVLPEWSRQFAYPEIRVASPTEFFEYIEKQYGPALPELSGDLNNFSADYATIDPESQGWKRRAARLLPLAESVGALASFVQPSYLMLPSVVDRTWTRLFDYDEHSWPTLPRASDVQLFNASWVKKHEAGRALDASEKLWQEASGAFSRNIATGDAETIAVFNGLAHQRSDLVSIPGDAPAMVDVATGENLATQKGADGRTLFVAKNIPAFGYKLYRLDRTALQPEAKLSAGAGFIANEFYDVRFDPATGGIRSIREKPSGRELVDHKAPHLLNQLVYVHKESRESKQGFQHSPAQARKQQSSAGPVAAQFDIWIDDDQTGAAVHQTVKLYAGLKRIDVVNRLEHARAMYTANYDERYRDNIYFAFPFRVEDGQFRVEYAGAVVRPYLDQLRWGSHDYLQANRWVDVSNATQGVTVAPWNAATFSFGEIRYNQFSIDYKPSNSHLFGYAWSNRMSGLLTLNSDDANASIGYSITSHDGDWNSGEATRFGWQTATPLEAIALPRGQQGAWKQASQSFLSVSATNVQMSVLKLSAQPGRGFVARFIETEGKATDFDMDLTRFQAGQAWLCDLVENDLKPLVVRNSVVRVHTEPHAFTTIRFLPEGTPAPDDAPQVAVTLTTDSSVRLTWNGANAAAWNVYRSVDPKDPAISQTLVARVTSPAFVDQGLYDKTRYYYQIASVNRQNQQGPLSPKVEAETGGANRTPPAPVEELGVVRRSKDRLMVYWRSNLEPDVARYTVYRGDTEDFAIVGANPLATLEPARYFLQLFVDEGLKPGHTYYYKVFAEDWAGNRQTISPVASATTPRE